jgi:hypothetical protein
MEASQAARWQVSDAADRLYEHGVPADAVREIIDEALNGLTQRMAAQARAVQGNPGLQQNLGAVDKFLEANDEVRQRAQAIASVDAGAGADYAWLQFQRANGGLSGGSASFTPGAGPNADELRKAWNENPTRENRDRFVKARLRQAIPDSFLNQ